MGRSPTTGVLYTKSSAKIVLKGRRLGDMLSYIEARRETACMVFAEGRKICSVKKFGKKFSKKFGKKLGKNVSYI